MLEANDGVAESSEVAENSEVAERLGDATGLAFSE